MDIKELDKKQLILLTLLITFVVSIATGIITVSLMNQMPKSVPQTINNVIQRTIEKVTTVETPVKDTNTPDITKSSTALIGGDGDAMVSIYSTKDESIGDQDTTVDSTTTPDQNPEVTSNTDSNNLTSEDSTLLGQGVIISDIGLVLVDSSILTESQSYKIVMNKMDFGATVLKKFDNGFTILKISQKASTETPTKTDTSKSTQ